MDQEKLNKVLKATAAGAISCLLVWGVLQALILMLLSYIGQGITEVKFGSIAFSAVFYTSIGAGIGALVGFFSKAEDEKEKTKASKSISDLKESKDKTESDSKDKESK